MRPKTINEGAGIQRKYLRAKLLRMRRSRPYAFAYREAVDELLEWLGAEPVRTAKRKGGLGTDRPPKLNRERKPRPPR